MGIKKYCMWVVDPEWYNIGCRRKLKYIFVGGGVKRKLNCMGSRVNKESAFSGGGDKLISGTALSHFVRNICIPKLS